MGSIVSAPADLVIATSDGINVRFTGIDLAAELSAHAQEPPGGHGVRVSLAAVRGAETMRRDGQFQAARLAWAQREDGGKRGKEPGGLTPDLGHAESSTMLGKRESKDGKEELHRRVPSPGGGLVRV
ncbi:hypothetical protein, partial [Kocuria rosea]|uniref:hypothetical protein n=1 Tax=Kocuria rosea TaxID=1275 RepID=UPI0011B1EB06